MDCRFGSNFLMVLISPTTSTTDLKLAYGDTTGLWQTFFVEQGGDALGTHASLAQAPDGAFYVSYYNDSLNRLRVARVVINNAVDDNCDGR